ncbi:MAG TPA: 2-oxo acid dehydrogenase subunit E2 [Bacteroidales bacterium]|nr:2-oxo acid dehydrogenase subunit E2 [Bacteroidales bacterium]
MNSDEQFNTPWRRVASTIYKKPTDSKILGGVELDVTDLESFISEKRREGHKITLTHFFVMTLARAIKEEIPEFNTYVRRGRILPRPSIDVAVSVLRSDGNMTSVIVPDAGNLSFDELEKYMNTEISRSRKGNESEAMQGKNFLARLPWPLRNWFYKTYRVLTLNWGVSIPGLGMAPNRNGSFLLTNIGTLGLDYGFPALLPTSNFSFVLVMGGIQKKPVVINDSVAIRRIMSVTIAIDHRMADASHGALLFRYMKQAIRNPERFW